MNRTQREKDKSLQEKHQTILSQLLKDEDNKYCVDCDAKGPRWASWNLGIFLCIRCAGIHRNLGVHISRVKSVNLDSWTSEQMQMVQEMGNSRARAVYEANLPDDYRRPQTDSALEFFIREKYEKKKYIAKEWIPPQPKSASSSVTEEKKEKKRPKPKASNTPLQLNSTSTSRPKSNTNATSPGPVSAPKAHKQPQVEKKAAASVDLLGLDHPSQGAAPASNTSNSSDPFGDFLSAAPTTTSPNKPAEPAAPPAATEDNASLFADMSLGAEKPKSTKDSIMALYGSGGGQSQQMFGVPGTTNPTPPMSTANTGATFGYYDGTNTNTNYGYYDQAPAAAGGVNTNYGYYEAGSTNPPTSGATNYYDQGGMYMPQQQAQYGMMQNGAMAQQNNMVQQNNLVQQNNMAQQNNMVPQNNMMANNLGLMQQQSQQGQMMNQNMGIPAGVNMHMMGAQPSVYNNQVQQQHLSQIQQQMASMKMNNPGMAVGMQQQAQPVGAGGMGWGTQQAGHTLSNNLWQ